MTTPQLLHLASDLESFGFSGQEVALRPVIRAARAAGVTSVLVDVLADPSEPEVARLRAFGRVATELATVASTDTVRTSRDAAA
jgi:hypothetical protein